jgi:hypothetical protein
MLLYDLANHVHRVVASKIVDTEERLIRISVNCRTREFPSFVARTTMVVWFEDQ